MPMDLFATLPSSFHLKLPFCIVLSAFYDDIEDYISPVIDFTLENINDHLWTPSSQDFESTIAG